jgi:hypothetical protein
MPSISITDLANAKTDVDHIAQLAVSTNATAVDRLGITKSTVKGAIDTLKAFNSRGAWVAGAAYAVKDLVTSGGTWYVCVLAHTSAAAFATDSTTKWRVHQGLTSQSLADSQYSRGVVSMSDYPTLKAAIEALPAGGGVVEIPVGRFPAGVWKFDTNYMSEKNVTLRGFQMPTPSDNCDRLQGGSIIEGRFNAFADNFTVENLGFDCGKYVIDTYYGGADTHSANHPNGDTWDAFAFAQPNQAAPLPLAKNLKVNNVIGLNRDSLCYGHAVLMEGFSSADIGSVIGMYGIHAVVVKGSNATAVSLAGYGASSDHVIFKSDNYAPGNNIKVGTVSYGFAPPGTTPWSTPAASAFGLFLNPATADMTGIKIGRLRGAGAQALIRASGTTATRVLDNVQIAAIELEGTGVANAIGANFDNAIFKRIRFGTITISNVADGMAYKQTVGFSDDAIEIGSLTMENVSLRGLQALGFGRFVINVLKVQTVGTLYAIENNARVHIGRESLSSVTTKFGLNPPSLTAGWQQIAGFSGFDVGMHNYGVTLQGLLQKTGAPSANVVNLPPYLQPAESIRLQTVARNAANVDGMVLVSVGGGATTLKINDGAGIVGAENFLSLDGLSYRLD